MCVSGIVRPPRNLHRTPTSSKVERRRRFSGEMVVCHIRSSKDCADRLTGRVQAILPPGRFLLQHFRSPLQWLPLFKRKNLLTAFLTMILSTTLTLTLHGITS